MARTEQSIDINVPIHVVYDQLTQFETYPRFMQELDSVQQTDDTHLHWNAHLGGHTVEWDAEITEQQPDRCIAWRSVEGPAVSGRVEVQPVGNGATHLTYTLQIDTQQDGKSAQGIEHQLQLDLEQLKRFIETRGDATGAWRGQVHDGQVTGQPLDTEPTGGTPEQRDALEAAQGQRGNPRNSPVPMSAYSADAEAGSAADARPDANLQSPQTGQPLQAQPTPVRHIGEMPQDTSGVRNDGNPTSDSIGKALQPGGQHLPDKEK